MYRHAFVSFIPHCMLNRILNNIFRKKKNGEKITVGETGENKKKKTWKPVRQVSTDEIKEINENWENAEETTKLWEMISNNEMNELLEHLMYYPEDAHLRSADGRGPMWWAYEYKSSTAIKVLKKLGVSDNLRDAKGLTPKHKNYEL